MSQIPDIRVRPLNDRQASPHGDYVLYWMIANRRAGYNFSLQQAAHWASELGKPLMVLEALRCDYQWASDRIHRFVIQGMVDNAADFADAPLTYYPYLETERGAGKGLLRSLSEHACVVVSDDFPAFFLPRMLKAAAARTPVLFEAVDSNGLLPMRAADKVFARAFDLRRYLQKNLLVHLAETPKPHPLQGFDLPQPPRVAREIQQKWPIADLDKVADSDEFLASLPIDHQVRPANFRGGSHAAKQTLEEFLGKKLPDYGNARNQPEQEVTSGLSPYLHFGHVSVHQVFEDLMQQEEWTPNKVSKKVTGSSKGWWGVSEDAESFIDELVTWRELGYNMCSKRDDYDQYESLPDWAQETLAEHASDKRDFVYTLAEFEHAQTHDKLWNAAQRQLVTEGRMHNYLRMLWGKKILEWSPSPRDALSVMIELNNKYALDGRNPNSYSGIFWTLGRYDRAWGPERQVFGKIRFMSSDNTARKVRVNQYLERYSSSGQQGHLAFGDG